TGETIAQMRQDQTATFAAAAAREIAANPSVADPAQLDAALAHVQSFHNVDMTALYRDGAIVKAQANPRAAIAELSDPPARFFADVAEKGSATKIDVVASGKGIRP